MIALLIFLVGVGVGAVLTYHLAQVSELRRKAQGLSKVGEPGDEDSRH